MGKISLRGRGEKSTHKRGDLFPSSHRVGSRVPPDPTSLRLVEMAPPLGAEVLRCRSGGPFKVMPPNGQRFFAEVMPFAAGGSPISLGSLSRRAVFRPGLGPMDVLPRLPDHDGAQGAGRHPLRSSLSWPRPRRRRLWLQGQFALGLRDPANPQAPVLNARDRRSGHGTKRQETLGPTRTPRLRSQRTRLLRPQAGSFSFAPGRAEFPRRSDLGAATGSIAKVPRLTTTAARLGK